MRGFLPYIWGAYGLFPEKIRHIFLPLYCGFESNIPERNIAVYIRVRVCAPARVLSEVDVSEDVGVSLGVYGGFARMEDGRFTVTEPRERAPRGSRQRQKTRREEYIAGLGISEAEQCLLTLSDEEVAFCCEMVSNGLDKVRAYRTVYDLDGDLDRTTYHRISRIMQRDDVRQLLRLGVQKRMGEVMDNLDAKLLETYVQRAFYDIADFHDGDGSCLPLNQIPEEKRCAIDKIETRYYGKDGDVRSVNYILANRDAALKVLSEYMDSLRPKTAAVDLTKAATDDGSADEVAEEMAAMSDDELRAELRRLG